MLYKLFAVFSVAGFVSSNVARESIYDSLIGILCIIK